MLINVLKLKKLEGRLNIEYRKGEEREGEGCVNSKKGEEIFRDFLVSLKESIL